MSEKRERSELSGADRGLVQPVGEKNGDCVAFDFWSPSRSGTIKNLSVRNSKVFASRVRAACSQFDVTLNDLGFAMGVGRGKNKRPGAHISTLLQLRQTETIAKKRAVQVATALVGLIIEKQNQTSKWTDHGHPKSKPRSSKWEK